MVVKNQGESRPHEKFAFKGCSVSFSFNANDSDKTITAIKEILLSAYRTGMTN